jgi:hypothetical protein
MEMLDAGKVYWRSALAHIPTLGFDPWREACRELA